MSASADIPGLLLGQPLDLATLTVAKSQVNALGHLKASEYIKLFDDTIPVFFPLTGLADADLLHGDTSPFLMDLHACYLAELSAGEAVRISAQLIDHDAKRARLILLMNAAADGRLAATCELLLVNMHVKARRPAAWSTAQQSIWTQIASAHASMSPPPQAGRSIGPLAMKH